MQYKILGDEMQIVLEKGDLQTDPPPSLSPTAAAAAVIGLEEVKKLLVELLPVVECMKNMRYVRSRGGITCPACRHWIIGGTPSTASHLEGCGKVIAQEILPRLRKMVEELEKI